MAYDFQVTVDAADPHAQANWWAETLGWEVEPADEELIRRMIAEGHATDDDTKIYNGALVWEDGAAIRSADGAAGGSRTRVLFQLVPGPKAMKNHVHLTVRAGEDHIETELARLTGRGATFLHRGQQGPHAWVTMADPEGNEFCLM
jgi:predicted enzyme related to lactoylglutathione lyase